MLDFLCTVLHSYHKLLHNAELRHIDIERRFRRHILFTDKILQKIFRFADDTAEHIGQPTACANGLACLVLYLGLLDFHNLCFCNSRNKSHIRCSVPFLPCFIIGFDFRFFRIVLADFLGRQIHAVVIKYFQVLFGIGNIAVDKGGVKLLFSLKKCFAFVAVIFYRKQMTFINLAFLDDGTALTDFSVFAGYLFLGAYPFTCFIIKYASAGNLDVSFGK